MHGEILQKLYDRLSFSTTRHSQVFVMSLVVSYPADRNYSIDNSLFCRFLADFIRSRSHLDPHYVWSREQSTDSPGRFHYHLSLFFNGNMTQNSIEHFHLAQYFWAKTLSIPDASGLVHLCQPQSPLSFNNSGFKLVRTDPHYNTIFQEVFHYLSYIAKTDTKCPMPGVRSFGCSELN